MGLTFCDLLMIVIIALSAHQNFQNIDIRMLLYLPQPRLHIIKGLHVRCVKCQKNALSALIVGLRDRSKPFLARSIPYLQLHILPIHLQILYLKINACRKNYQCVIFGFAIFDLPIVAMCCALNVFSANQSKREVLPTLVSPIMISFIK